jgi:hypothetical protein
MGITGRPKSQNPKSIMASVRITERERDLLMLGHGTVNAGLRAALNQLLTVEVRTEPADAGDVLMSTGQGGSGGGDPVSSRHVHKPLSLVRDFADQGTMMQEWMCSCGHLMTRRAA